MFFRYQPFLPFDYFGVASFFAVFFEDIVADCLFAQDTFSASHAFMDGMDLCVGKVPASRNYASVRGHYCEHVVESNLKNDICAEDMQVLMSEQTIAA